MLLFPTTLLFQVTKAMEEGLVRLRDGQPLEKENAVTMEQFEDIVDMPYWKEIEDTFGGR